MILLPPSPDRIVAHLTGRGFHVETTADDGVVGRWDDHHFLFQLLGEDRTILQVRGRSGRALRDDQRASALLAVNDWNRDRIWPKCYLRAEGDRLFCYTEVNVPLRRGATDAQLGRFLDCGLGAGLQFLTTLPEHLLEPAEG